MWRLRTAFFLYALNVSVCFLYNSIENKKLKNSILSLDVLSNLQNKFIYFFLHFKIFPAHQKNYIKLISKKNYKSKLIKKELKHKDLGILHITFTKRNAFINLSTHNYNTILLTTLRREGFLGRRRQEYVSLFTTIRVVKKKLSKFKFKRLALVYSG